MTAKIKMKNLYFKIENGKIDYGGNLTYEDNQYIVAAEGDVYIGEKFASLLQIAELLHSGENSLASLDGVYSIISFNKQSKELVAVQDYFSYIHPLYFCATDCGIHIALFLRQIVAERKDIACLERENIVEFLYNGFLTDDRCLIRGVKKVPAMHVLIYDDNRHSVRYFKRQFIVDADYCSESDYFNLIKNDLVGFLSKNPRLNMALSSGYDSNFLLCAVNRIKPGATINAYTIGSADGNDEIQAVKEICSHHPEVILKIDKVTPGVLCNLPQMVYELEDSVFERGIFLQYVIGNAIRTDGEKSLLLGEGADQVLSSEFNTQCKSYYFVGKEQHYPWVYYPYEMLTYIILKKNGIFLRNRDVTPCYPFLRADFIKKVSSLRKLNGTSKEHYKHYVASMAGKEVGKILIKRPGSTNLSSLLSDSNLWILNQARGSSFYSMLPPQPDRDSGSEAELDSCLKVLFLIVFEQIFCRHAGKQLKDKHFDCPLDELIKEYLKNKGV